MKRAPLLVALGFCVVAQTVQAADLPQNGAVTRGTATITTAANKVTINQTTDRAIITWSEFNVGAGKTVEFQVPKHDSATLNKVTSLNPSTISGTIQSNGIVYLVNPNGLVFDLGAKVYSYRSYFTVMPLQDDQFSTNAGAKPATDNDIVTVLTPNREDSWLKLMVVCPCTALGTYDIIETQPVVRPKMEILANGEVKISNGADINIVYARGPSDADKSTAYSPATLTQAEKNNLPKLYIEDSSSGPVPNPLIITSSKLTIDNGSKVTGGTDAEKTMVLYYSGNKLLIDNGSMVNLNYYGSELMIDNGSKVNLDAENFKVENQSFPKTVTVDNNSELKFNYNSSYRDYSVALSKLTLDHGAKFNLISNDSSNGALYVKDLTVKNGAQLTAFYIIYVQGSTAGQNAVPAATGGKWDTDGGIITTTGFSLNTYDDDARVATKPTFKIGVVKPLVSLQSLVTVAINDSGTTTRDLLNAKVKTIFIQPITDPIKFVANRNDATTVFYDKDTPYSPSATLPVASCVVATAYFCGKAIGW